eukprot:Hpha_TRINITY_DN16543_c0_g1::TRINITY_DN16543_c0_g1_i7::g.136090::m.136090
MLLLKLQCAAPAGLSTALLGGTVTITIDSEYEGGRLCYYTRSRGVEVLRRRAGALTWHNHEVLHAVTHLSRGTRYSLFVVTEANGLGDLSVFNLNEEEVRDAVAQIGPVHFNKEIPFAELTLREQIGRGAFKTVHRGEWSMLPGKTTAILQVPKVEGGMEVEIMNTIGRHPHLLLFYGVSHRDDYTFFVVEYAPLRSLREHLLDLEEKGEALTPIVSVECALQVASGMMQLSALKIIHRDLAARNVLVFAFNCQRHHLVSLKVADFGLAREGGDADLAARAYYYGGGRQIPVRWSPPEVLTRHKYSEKSDVWSFGVFAWEVFTMGMVPYFELTSDKEVIQAVTQGTRLEKPADCPDVVFREIMLPCWNKGPGTRPTLEKLHTTIREKQAELLVQTAGAAVAECVICMDDPAKFAVVPCGHQCVCKKAVCQAAARQGCPICRGPCDQVIEIFASSK